MAFLQARPVHRFWGDTGHQPFNAYKYRNTHRNKFIRKSCNPRSHWLGCLSLDKHLPKGLTMTSKYEQMKAAGIISRGRSKKKLSKQEVKEREEKAKVANRQRQEARRRASIILQKTYKDEFDDLYQRELAELKTTDEQN